MTLTTGDFGRKRGMGLRFGRDIKSVAVARLVSEMGDELALIALIFRLKDSGTGAVSLLLAVFAATRILLSPLTGSIVDRFATRGLIASVSCLQFVVAATLAFIQGGFVYPLVFLLAVGGSIIGPAWQSFVAHVVPPHDLSRTYAFIQSYRSVAIAAGAGIGGFVVDRFGSQLALLLDAMSFLFVAGVAAALTTQRVPTDHPRGITGFSRGFVVFLRTPVLLWSLLLLASFNMSAGIIEVLSAFFVSDELHGSASDYGIILGALGASMFATGVVLSRIKLRQRDTTLLMASAVTSALGMFAYGMSTNIAYAVLAFVLNGIGLTGLHVFGTPVLVRHTRDEERGRVFAASSSVTMGGTLLATGIAGAIGEMFPPRPIIASAGLACLTFAFVGGTQIRRNDRLVEPTSG